MDPDLIFVAGVALVALSLPAVLNAFSTSGRSFVPAIALAVFGSALIVLASFLTTGEGYALTDIPGIIREFLK